ncbi:pyridoxamine 5'-phosphate oxidase family protein [Aerococcaceae bacterium DSM 111022]|nr:pyridoxamine 5'-phosphate oxidase family protein [Aerococcaceae bacterium DSM 111022]
MQVSEIMNILKDDMGIAVISSVDADGKPHARYINIGVANEEGVFFMTSPKTNFHAQLEVNQNIALVGLNKEEYLIQVIRIEGKVRKLGKDMLEKVLEGNEYVNMVYPDADEQANVQVFQLYEGEGFYQSLTQGHKYVFSIGK